MPYSLRALTAILVVAIATVLAVNLLWQTSVDLRRTETLPLQDQARQYDLGGEEFAITLVQPPLPKAAAVAERLRKAVGDLVIEHAGRQMTVTISLGIAEINDSINSLDHLISNADACLYTAKREGRNRVCAADDAPLQGSSA